MDSEFKYQSRISSFVSAWQQKQTYSSEKLLNKKPCENKIEIHTMAQNPSSDDSDYQSAPPAPPAVYQDKPPSYDEAISGKAPAPDAVGFTYPNQPGLQNKGEYCPSVPQYGPG